MAVLGNEKLGVFTRSTHTHVQLFEQSTHKHCYSPTNSTRATQILMNKSLVMFATKESGFDSLLGNQKGEHL